MSDAAFGKAHVPVGPEGSGFYSASTLGCFSVIQSAIPMVVDSIGKVIWAHFGDIVFPAVERLRREPTHERCANPCLDR